MLTTIISLLVALGLITGQADFEQRSQQEQEELIEIVINDVYQG
jgi:hypothetical protein